MKKKKFLMTYEVFQKKAEKKGWGLHKTSSHKN